MVRSSGLCMIVLFQWACGGALGFGDTGKKRPGNSATDRKHKLAEDAEEGARDAGDAEDAGDAGGGSGKRPPRVEVSDDDPSEIREAAAEVEKMEEALETGDFAAYGTAQGRAARSLDEDDAKESSKHKPLGKRIRALDVRFAAQAGGHAAEIMEDGERTREASADGLTAVKEALHACNQAAKATLSTDASGRAVELEEAYARYEKKLARARKVDARALRHVGKEADGLGNHDHALDFALCEAEVTAKRLDHEDRDPVERYERTSTTQCGYYEWDFAAPRLIGGGFASFELDGVQEDNAYAYPCKKFPKKSKVPKALKGAIKDGLIVSRGEVLVMQGDFRVSETGDGLVKKFATVRHYSKKTKIRTGECGESDPKIGCQNNSSPTALRYNQVSHYSKRAAAHRKVGRAARCKELLKKATDYAEDWARNEANGSNDADERFTRLKTIDGIMSKAEAIAALKKLGSQADDRALGPWCAGSSKESKESK
jgi:hypothetical protein